MSGVSIWSDRVVVMLIFRGKIYYLRAIAYAAFWGPSDAYCAEQYQVRGGQDWEISHVCECQWDNHVSLLYIRTSQ